MRERKAAFFRNKPNVYDFFAVLLIVVSLYLVASYSAENYSATGYQVAGQSCSDGTKLNSCNSNGQKCIESSARTASFKIAADDKFLLYINGKYIAGGFSASDIKTTDLQVKPGDILLFAVIDQGKGDPIRNAGLIVSSTIDGKQFIVSND
ncbi:MAG: hypothetical protein QMD85_01555, partial [Candidatus Aenigmarchaeota archaeon]|nr:hypothetical protein [Candidatus Aenigmarchaeota archaeon]MDI6722225.1 hypothetical protein [Candidatus Aenigmarchaeota archaeon]